MAGVIERSPVSLEIADVAFGGKGVGRLPEGKACFVPGVIAGERVAVEIIRDTTRFAEAGLLRILEASPQRVAAPCPYFGSCGGCAYQHMPYAMQLELKRGQVAQVLRRLGGFEDPVVDEVVPSPKPFGYRNRITVHCRGNRIGFHRQGGRGLVDIERCLLASEPVNALLASLRCHPAREGARTLREHNDRFGFHQTNDAVAGLLADAVADACAPGGPLLIDAYCGAGFFAKRLRAMFARVIGIEWSARSVELAREGAAANEEYLEGDVAERLAGVLADPECAGATVILDPPAQGVDERVLAALLGQPVSRLIYVSCNPATLARDLKRIRSGYRLDRVQPFDMFPQTAEVEVLAIMVRQIGVQA
jgi:23S rRNA (uracil1939-C5)-methyltransferase